MTRSELEELLRPHFDSDWYGDQYHSSLSALNVTNLPLFEFYLEIGGRLGHDPNPEFSELWYRHAHPDVYQLILKNESMWAYVHFLRFGQYEKSRKRPTAEERDSIRTIVSQLDTTFLDRSYVIDCQEYISAFDFYFLNVKAMKLSPSAVFSETSYRDLNSDVDAAIAAGDVLCGFAHFLSTMNAERRTFLSVREHELRIRQNCLENRRQSLECNLPGVTHPYALDLLDRFNSLTREVSVSLEDSPESGFIVLVPHFVPEIIFGGYIAFFHFLEQLKLRTNADLRLVIFNDAPIETHKWNIARMRLQYQRIVSLFSSIDFVSNNTSLALPRRSRIISYSTETHYLADQLGRSLGSTPLFFIQEYEPDFHGRGDYHTFSHNSFDLPHYGIYNTRVLSQFFTDNVIASSPSRRQYKFCSFENFTDRLEISKAEFVARNRDKPIRKLIFYGRPEQHAARNGFATFVMGLRLAIKEGHFDESQWSFVSIGSLAYEGTLQLSPRCRLEIVSKVTQREYQDFLHFGDIGVSFISTPHPGIVHFQMAKFGLTTVTNVADNRSREWLRTQSDNIIGVHLSPEDIAAGLGLAVVRSMDLSARYDNAMASFHLSRSECLDPALDAVIDESAIKPSVPPRNALTGFRKLVREARLVPITRTAMQALEAQAGG
jgi:hypothetical protein